MTESQHGHATTGPGTPGRLRVATYNVHRWAGVRGGKQWVPELAQAVLEELDADVIALQEVLYPHDGFNPLEETAAALGLHVAFEPARRHRRGLLGNAILSRWAPDRVFTLDLSFSRLEQRSAVAAHYDGGMRLSVVATHLALVDRTRRHQVHTLLEHPELQGPVVLLGDMNAWRRCKATRALEEAFTERHHNANWPPSFPAARPVLALDRVYVRGARLIGLDAHVTTVARRASDHLPVVATLSLDDF